MAKRIVMETRRAGRAPRSKEPRKPVEQPQGWRSLAELAAELVEQAKRERASHE